MSGLEYRYYVERIRKGENEPVEDFCFVLRPERDPVARVALEAYARALPQGHLRDDLSRYLLELKAVA